MKALYKKQTILQAVAYLGIPAPRDKLSLGLPTSPCNLMLYLQLSNTKDKFAF